jgi:predicted Zn finger-like uncharacterized protein
MKIVCDACQAKYSIADEKVQGKAFKIRCKKCNHIIVVRTGGERAAAVAAEPKPAPAEAQGTWYIVVEGEQVGPLAEPDIAARLVRGEITSDTLVWKEGFADWVKLSAVPELAQAPASQAAPATQPAAGLAAEPAPARRDSARMRSHGSAREAARTAGLSEDLFSKPAASAGGSADLFASPVAAEAPAAASSPFAFGAAAAPAAEPAPRASGNGAGQSHLTGQRNENSVLFSLANLEALAVPSSSSSARAPSTASTTEGSGLIDIRSMAARTIGESGRGDSFGGSDALPTFSTPQFSPVAPVLLPMGSSGPPKWVYPVLVVLAIGIVALGFGIYRVVSAPPPASPPPAQIVLSPPAAPAPRAAAAPSPGVTAPAEAAKPGAIEEKPAEDKGTPERKKPSGKGGRTTAKGTIEAAPSAKGEKPAPQAAAPTAAPTKPKKGGSIDDLLDQVGTNKRGGGEASQPKKPPTTAALPALSQSDIVSAMKAVQPRVKECYNQYKVPGIANVSISVSKGGRIASASVTGKFAGTPSGTCVEAAAKTARFPPCEAMSFPWPFQLH